MNRHPLPSAPPRANVEEEDWSHEEKLTLDSIKGKQRTIHCGLRSTYTTFTQHDALRELAQNWKDAMTVSFDTKLCFKTERNNTEIVYKAYGYDTGPENCLGYILFRGKEGTGTVEITNRGSRLEPYHLEMGGTTKADNPELAGVHGEGLKIALLVFQRDEYNHGIRCQSGCFNWSFGLSTQGKLVTKLYRLAEIRKRQEKHPRNSLAPFDPCHIKDVKFVIGDRTKKRNEQGEWVIRRPVRREDFESWCTSVLFLQEFQDEDMLKTNHGSLIRNPTYKGSLYLKGLLMRSSTYSSSASMTGRPLKYGYDFGDGTTNRDRRTLGSAEDEGRAILAIWQELLEKRPGLTRELSDILNSSDPQWAEASMVSGGVCFPFGKKLARHLTSDSSKRYYSAREKEENPRLDGIIASFGRQGVQLNTSYWDALAALDLLCTAEEGQLRHLHSAVDVPIPDHRFAQLMERRLRACLRACPQTSSLKLGFVEAGDVSLQTFYQENDDERVRVHKRWLHLETAMQKFAFLGPVSEMDLVLHACRFLFREIIGQLGADRFAGSGGQALIALKEEQLCMAEQMLVEHMLQDSALRLRKTSANSVAVSWQALQTTRSAPPFEVALHEASTCLRLKQQLLARDIVRLGPACGSVRATTCCRQPAVSVEESQSITYQGIFNNLMQGVEYFAIIYRPDKPTSLATSTGTFTLPVEARGPSSFHANTAAELQTPSRPFPSGQQFAGGFPGQAHSWHVPPGNQPPVEARVPMNHHPGQAFTGYPGVSGVMGQSVRKRQRR